MIASQPKSPISLPPKDAPVVAAFSKQKALCEGLVDWNVEAGTEDWIDISIEWMAIDIATTQDNVRHIKLETSVDGTTLADTMKYPTISEPFSINCSGTVIEGSSIKYALFIPPLPKGEHKITWHVIVEDDLKDGWNDYPKGTELALTATVMIHQLPFQAFFSSKRQTLR
jgi:hypothetical protein